MVKSPLLLAVVATFAAGCATHERITRATNARETRRELDGPAAPRVPQGTGEQGATGNQGRPASRCRPPVRVAKRVLPGVQGPAGMTGATGKMVVGRAG
jgi:hypothetical protein